MSKQLTLQVVAKEVDGIEMGVLGDGRAYLTGRGLARLCGAAASTIINQKDEWAAGKRSNRLAKMLQEQGFDEPELCLTLDGGVNAYPEDVCMFFLEYFAFDSTSPSDVAQSNYRKLARAGLRIFVYRALGFAAQVPVPVEWQKFHDRMLLVSAPLGYFSIFREMADVVLASIRDGLPVDEKTIPDISAGQHWAEHWKKKKFEENYGERRKHEHNYPDYFPQALSNPQDIWVYPIAALGDFRIWLQGTYLPSKFPKYLATKVSAGVLTASTAQMLVAANTPAALKP